MSRIFVTKQAEIATAHRCFNPAWDQARNEAVYGIESRTHGHNYLVEATVSGEMDPKTGMVTNVKTLKAALLGMLADFDHRSMNGDHPRFTRLVPTAERILEAMWDTLEPRITEGRLERLCFTEGAGTCYETGRPGVRPHRENAMHITRAYRFSAAHRLHSPHLSEEQNCQVFGNCNNPNGHGHDYTLEVTVTGAVQPESGLSVDQRRLDETIRGTIVERYHYRHLNDDVPEFAHQITTSENIVRVIWEQLEKQLGAGVLYRIRLGETRDNYFEFYG